MCTLLYVYVFPFIVCVCEWVFGKVCVTNIPVFTVCGGSCVHACAFVCTIGHMLVCDLRF